MHACCVGSEDLSIDEQGWGTQGVQRLVLELRKQRILVWTADEFQRRQGLCGHFESDASNQREVFAGEIHVTVIRILPRVLNSTKKVA